MLKLFNFIKNIISIIIQTWRQDFIENYNKSKDFIIINNVGEVQIDDLSIETFLELFSEMEYNNSGYLMNINVYYTFVTQYLFAINFYSPGFFSSEEYENTFKFDYCNATLLIDVDWEQKIYKLTGMTLQGNWIVGDEAGRSIDYFLEGINDMLVIQKNAL